MSSSCWWKHIAGLGNRTVCMGCVLLARLTRLPEYGCMNMRASGSGLSVSGWWHNWLSASWWHHCNAIGWWHHCNAIGWWHQCNPFLGYRCIRPPIATARCHLPVESCASVCYLNYMYSKSTNNKTTDVMYDTRVHKNGRLLEIHTLIL